MTRNDPNPNSCPQKKGKNTKKKEKKGKKENKRKKKVKKKKKEKNGSLPNRKVGLSSIPSRKTFNHANLNSDGWYRPPVALVKAQ